MAWKLHCDSCDAVIPEGAEAIALIPLDRAYNYDWKHGGRDRERVGCMPCVAALLPGPPMAGAS